MLSTCWPWKIKGSWTLLPPKVESTLLLETGRALGPINYDRMKPYRLPGEALGALIFCSRGMLALQEATNV